MSHRWARSATEDYVGSVETMNFILLVQLVMIDALLYWLAHYVHYSKNAVLLMAQLLDITILIVIIFMIAEMIFGVELLRSGRPRRN
ncbi:unnamed protein product [Notodromas monacha]|uniref:Uncharacterized protein n=1 Tax=Notodromas monacha TaxID=399045 RepID=A0A7R9BJJ3_9CRUS|nr:unnamed protein product [Notodromas monacha]CAG0916629.1 unnamed protein product [Notodromas monacha]